MDTVLLLIWLVMSAVVADASNATEDPDYIEAVEEVRRDLEDFLERKNFDSFESDDENSSEERDTIEQQIDSLPSDFRTMPDGPITPVIESFATTVDSLPSEQMDEATPVSSKYGYKVDSIKGMPGVHFPDYTDIPVTSFSCADKPYVPGFYADLDTGCQVFHACWDDKRETFLCPMGTTFNQALLACDYWYSSSCSEAPLYYTVNEDNKFDFSDVQENDDLLSMLDVFLGSKSDKYLASSKKGVIPVSVSSFVTQFMPVKAKVSFYPESGQRSTIVASVSNDEQSMLEVKSRRARESPYIGSEYFDNPEKNFRVRHLFHSLDEKLDQILADFKKTGSIRDHRLVEVIVKNLKKKLRVIDPEFFNFDMAKLNSADIKNMTKLMDLLQRISNYLFKDSVLLYDIIIGKDDSVSTSDAPDHGDGRSIRDQKSRRARDVSSIRSSKYSETREEFESLAYRLDKKFKQIIEKIKRTPSVSDHENKKSKCLTKPTLNPRFITKPATEKPPAVKSEEFSSNLNESLHLQSSTHREVKSSTSTRRVTISEKTKKALLINYIRLIKIKAKRSYADA